MMSAEVGPGIYPGVNGSNRFIPRIDNMKKKFNVKTGTEAGDTHVEEGNQDAFHVYEKDGIQVAVVCDGAGSAIHAQAGASAMSELLANYIGIFEEKFAIQTTTQQRTSLMYVIWSVLQDLVAANAGTEYESYGSTIMAMIVNRCENRWTAVHLGDGIILKKEEGEEYDVISMGEHEIFANCTYLTTSPDLFDHLHIYQGSLDKIEQFILVTDGFSPYNIDIGELLGRIDKFMLDDIMPPGQDDKTIVALYR